MKALIEGLIAVLISVVVLLAIMPGARASELPGTTMSILHYSQFKDVFMMAKCIEVGKADRAEFSYAYMLLNQRDPMAVMAIQAGGDTLPKYLGPTLSRDLGNTIDSFQFLQGKNLDDYCKYTAIRATAPR